ncbi:hypothetical protein BC936DRAFT_141507 [Jimgerdemannia flammicorona]|uniref:Uncharacterized protein n=1 Tax=Jimgerdemannia flammicorona TaxID=994334 RepID=A0A433DG35_9FUNG|nr:hypothetical protein BC936DRAFT_141507 [Jimgerdemannia flammicorona]
MLLDKPSGPWPKTTHKYFKKKSLDWNIIDFLNSCGIEPFERKIECYLSCLKAISRNGKGCRSDKAQQLLNRYMKASIVHTYTNHMYLYSGDIHGVTKRFELLCHTRLRAEPLWCWGVGDLRGCLRSRLRADLIPILLRTIWNNDRIDRKLSRNWEKFRSQNSSLTMHIHNPKFTANSQAGIINGGTFLNLSSGYQDEGKSEQARNDDDSISSDIGDENSIGDFPPKSAMGTENLLFTPHKQSVEDDMVKRFINDLPLICAFGMSSEQLELAVGPKLAQQTISVRSQNPSSWTPATVKYLNDVFSKNTGQHFESAIQSSIDDDDDDGHFRLYCKKILVDLL